MSRSSVVTPKSRAFRPYLLLIKGAPWLVFAGFPLLMAIYLVSSEPGATALISSAYIHKFMHDGGHSLGLACH